MNYRVLAINNYSHLPQVYIKAVYGNYVGRKAYEDTTTLDGGKFSGVPWNSALIEGKGRFRNEITGDLFPIPTDTRRCMDVNETSKH